VESAASQLVFCREVQGGLDRIETAGELAGMRGRTQVFQRHLDCQACVSYIGDFLRNPGVIELQFRTQTFAGFADQTALMDGCAEALQTQRNQYADCDDQDVG
jgi:hypothetical protein